MSSAGVDKVCLLLHARQQGPRCHLLALGMANCLSVCLVQAVQRLKQAAAQGSAYEGLQSAKSVYHRCRSKRQYEASYDLAQARPDALAMHC